MAKKSSGFSLSTIIFMVIAYNLFFGGDDEDKNQVEIVDQDQVTIEETIKEKTNQLKEGFATVVKEASEALADAKKEKQVQTSEDPEPKPEKPPEEREEMIAKPETEELTPLNQKQDKGFKKL